jgi:hypothetical protein
MVAHKINDPFGHDRNQVIILIQKRLKEMHRRENHTHNLNLRSFYESQEAILEEVLQMAHGKEDDATLMRIIDYCIQESLDNKKMTTSPGLKSYYSLRLRVLRGALRLVRALRHPKRWLRKKRNRTK